MKYVYIILNIIALIISIIWLINSKYDYEPIIVSITLLITLIGLIYSFGSSKRINIKGNKNFTRQDSRESELDIEGDENITFQ